MFIIGWVVVGRNVGGFVFFFEIFCFWVLFGIGVKRKRVGFVEFGVCRGVVFVEFGVIGRFWGVLGVLNFGDDWKGDGVCGIVGWMGVVGDIIDGVIDFILVW